MRMNLIFLGLVLSLYVFALVLSTLSLIASWQREPRTPPVISSANDARQWRTLKVNELKARETYRDKATCKPVFILTEGTTIMPDGIVVLPARGVKWDATNQRHTFISIYDDQLEERVDRPVLPELPDREPERTWGKEAKFPEREEKQG